MATKSDILSDYYKMPKTKAGVLADYNKMVRLSNDRMRAIEDAKVKKSGTEAMTEYAYKRAVHDLAGATRFPSAKKIEDMNYNSIVKKMQDMRRFLKSESSTSRGVKAMYRRNAEKFNKKYGTNFSTSEMAKFFNKNTGLYEKIKKDHPEWGSETVMRAIAKIENDKEKILDKIKAENEIHIEVEEVKVEEITNDIISQYPEQIQGWLR